MVEPLDAEDDAVGAPPLTGRAGNGGVVKPENDLEPSDEVDD